MILSVNWSLSGSLQYSDTQLYNQLRCYAYLFDGEAALRRSRGAEHEGLSVYPSKMHFDAHTIVDQVKALTSRHAGFLSALGRALERFLDENARRWVDMRSLLSFMKIS